MAIVDSVVTAPTAPPVKLEAVVTAAFQPFESTDGQLAMVEVQRTFELASSSCTLSPMSPLWQQSCRGYMKTDTTDTGSLNALVKVVLVVPEQVLAHHVEMSPSLMEDKDAPAAVLEAVAIAPAALAAQFFPAASST